MEFLIKSIVDLVLHLPEGEIGKLLNLLEKGYLTPDSTLNTILNKREMLKISPALLNSFLKAWKTDRSISGESVALAIQTAAHTQKILEATKPSIELTWTGPWVPENHNIRSSFPVMLEMIDTATSNIILTGYSISPGSEKIRKLFALMEQKLRNGCALILLVDNSPETLNNVKALLPYLYKSVLFTWKPEEFQGSSSLHSKMLIVDDSDMLIGSANLSFSGMENNIETGLRITGSNYAQTMSNHIRKMISQGVFIPIR